MYLPRSRAATGNSGLLRAPHPLVETAPSKLTLRRDSDCVQVARQQPPPRRDIPTLVRPNVPSDHDGAILAVTSVAHADQHPPSLVD